MVQSSAATTVMVIGFVTIGFSVKNPTGGETVAIPY
jgi:Na+/phosphate symporter